MAMPTSPSVRARSSRRTIQSTQTASTNRPLMVSGLPCGGVSSLRLTSGCAVAASIMRPRSGRHQERGHQHQPSLRRGVRGSRRAPICCSVRRRVRAPRRAQRECGTRPSARALRASLPKESRSPDPLDGGRVGAGIRRGGAVAGWPSAGGVTLACAVAAPIMRPRSGRHQ